jgi:hypothetical protein
MFKQSEQIVLRRDISSCDSCDSRGPLQHWHRIVERSEAFLGFGAIVLGFDELGFGSSHAMYGRILV